MLNSGQNKFFECFLSDRRGIAATEFALLLPVMIMLLFGVVEGSDALSQSRRVTQAANVLADLTAQESEILTADVDDLFDGVSQILDSAGVAVNVRLVSVIANPDGDPMVHWSRDNNGAQPYTPGTPFTKLPSSTLLDPGASLIVAEISYPWASQISSHVFSSKTFDERAIRWPRRAAAIELCSSAGNCTSAADVIYSG